MEVVSVQHRDIREAGHSEDEDDDDELFVDVEDPDAKQDYAPRDGLADLSLEQCIAVVGRAMDLFMNNQYAESRGLLVDGRNSSVYHAIGYGTFAFLQAVMTMNGSDIESAVTALKSTVHVCNGFRKKESVKQAVTKIVRGKKYSNYSEEERHAELCYAEGILEKAALTFLEDETLSSFVKGALQIRHGYYAYRECWNILKEQPKWRSEVLRTNFESGVRLGVGAFNLLISMLPARILKILEWIGFSGTKEVGLAQLEKSYESGSGPRSLLSALVLLVYHTFLCFFAGVGDGDVDKARRMLEGIMEKHPNGAFCLFFSGRVEFVSGNVEAAMRQYARSIASQDEYIQFHHFCHWELSFCHIFMSDWRGAAETVGTLLKESKWSPCFYAYFRAACMLMIVDRTKEEDDEIEELMRSVPKLKQRIAGKSIPLEKYCVRKAEKYFAQNRSLVLPGLEVVFVWNYFGILAKRRDLLDKIYSRILAEMKMVEEDAGMSETSRSENLCLCKVLAGCCLRWMQLPNLAEEHLEDALAHRCVDDKWLLPYAAAELGYLYLAEGDRARAKRQLEAARSGYSEYSLESRLHFRVHVALNKVAEMEKEEKNGRDG